MPDAHIGFLASGLTMGIVLSVPMILAGLYAIARALRNAPAAPLPADKTQGDEETAK